MTPREFDKYAEHYDELLADPIRELFAKGTEFFHRRKIEVLCEALKACGKSPEKLSWVDVGCGKGDLLRLGVGRFAAASGCDLSAGLLSYCQGFDVRLQTSCAELPFEPGSADVVTAACVYHHVELPVRPALTQAAAGILKPGGVFCIFEHNPWNPVTQWVVKRSPVDVNAILLRPSETEHLLEQAGLRLLATKYFLFVPQRLYGVLSPLERWLAACPLGGQYASLGVNPVA